VGPEAGQPATEADGVMVISAWTSRETGRLLARVTITARPEDAAASEVRVVATPDDLHALLDEWLISLRR
jgi:hypothetical protein